MSGMDQPILIVEDNPDDLFILKRSFKTAGISNELRHVEDGQQAIDYLQGVSPYFDRTTYPLPTLVLLDLKLPVKNGFEVLAWARQQPLLKNLVILVLTSSNDGGDISKSYGLGANAFLVKPTSMEKLTEMIRALDTFWLRHNRYSV